MGKEKQIRYCRKCGAKLNVPGGECLSCRTQMKTSLGSKNEIFSVVLSFFLPGLGQLYNGQKIKALFIFFIFLLLFTFQLFPFLQFTPIIGIVTLLIRILSIVDAYLTSNYINHGKFTEDTLVDFFKFLR